MTDTSAPHTDPGLVGNEKIEDAILALQQEASQSKGIIGSNDCVELFDTVNQAIKLPICQMHSVLPKSVALKFRFHLKKGKPAAQRIIQHRKTSVRGVHHSNDIKLGRHRKFIAGIQ